MPGLLRRSRLQLRRWSSELLDEFAPTQQQLAQELAEEAEGQAAIWQPDPRHAYCQRCGATAGPGAATDRGCAYCIEADHIPWGSIIRLSAFVSPVDQWLHAFKYHGQWTWADWFGQHLAEAVQQRGWEEPVVFCPVPMHWTRRWSRGYNQAALLAESLSLETGYPYAHLLRRVRRTPAQTLVDRSRRKTNLRDAIDSRPIDLAGWHVVLVDDVKTTGSTLSACAKPLRRMQAGRISAVCVAVADPSRQNFSVL